MELMKVLSNPIRMQVMQYLQAHGEAKTKQISEAKSETGSGMEKMIGEE